MRRIPCTQDCREANGCNGPEKCCRCGVEKCHSDLNFDGEFHYCDEHWKERCRTIAEDAKECETCAFCEGGQCRTLGRCDATNSGWVWNEVIEA